MSSEEEYPTSLPTLACVEIGGAVEVFVIKMDDVMFVEMAGMVEVSAEIGGAVGVFAETRGVVGVSVTGGSRRGAAEDRMLSRCCSSWWFLASGLTNSAP